MELHRKEESISLPVYSLHDSVRAEGIRHQPGGEGLDSLMVESIDLYFLFTQNLMHGTAFYH